MATQRKICSWVVASACMAGGIAAQDSEGVRKLATLDLVKLSQSPIVSAASTDRELLEWLRARVGGTIIQKRTYQPHHSRSFDWKLTDRRALSFLKIVRPFLVIQRKIERADLLLKDYLACTPRNGRYTVEMATRKQALIERFSSLP